MSSRMKLRAQILRMLNKYRSDFEQSDNEVCDDISFLKQTNNPEFVAKILFKEIASQESEKYINICSLFYIKMITAIFLIRNKADITGFYTQLLLFFRI